MTDISKKVRHKLLEPITVEGRQLGEIDLRRIKGKDLRDMDREESGLDKTAFLICRLGNLPPEAFDELDAADIESLGEVIEGFMNRKAKKR